MRITYRVGDRKRSEMAAHFECHGCSQTADAFRVTLNGLNAGDQVQVMAVRAEGQLGIVPWPEGTADSEGTFTFEALFRPPDRGDA